MQRLQRKEAMDYPLAIIILMDHFSKEYERKLTRSKKKPFWCLFFDFENKLFSKKPDDFLLTFVEIPSPKRERKKPTRLKRNKLLLFVSNFFDLKPT